jgi:hypothetical protein
MRQQIHQKHIDSLNRLGTHRFTYILLADILPMSRARMPVVDPASGRPAVGAFYEFARKLDPVLETSRKDTVEV